mmetsp:Transcript_6055/g.17122  ORF Transcript_6055/g.17122 Transcript_6055/m.17122 type:complete len:259 (+) Transcript_6055:286-1062(+)
MHYGGEGAKELVPTDEDEAEVLVGPVVVNVVGSAPAPQRHLRKRHPVVRGPDDVVARVLLDEADGPEGDKAPEGQRVRRLYEDGVEELTQNHHRVLEGVDPAPGPRERGVIRVVHVVDVLAQVRDDVHDAVLPVDQKVPHQEHQGRLHQELRDGRGGARQLHELRHQVREKSVEAPIDHHLRGARPHHVHPRRPVVLLDLRIVTHDILIGKVYARQRIHQKSKPTCEQPVRNIGIPIVQNTIPHWLQDQLFPTPNPKG